MPQPASRLNRKPTAGHGAADLAVRLADHRQLQAPRLRRLWDYYRNPAQSGPDGTTPAGSQGLAQAVGLPERLRPGNGRHREVVIENDIAWRIDTVVDFMFGRPPVIRSLAPDPGRASEIARFLDAVFNASGGPGLWQDTALLGTVYGHVDLLLNIRPPRSVIRIRPPQSACLFTKRSRPLATIVFRLTMPRVYGFGHWSTWLKTPAPTTSSS